MKRRGWLIALAVGGALALGLAGNSVLRERQARRERAEAVRAHDEALKALDAEARRRAEREAVAGASRTQCFGDGGAPAEWRCR
jgi:hypothetical protein